MPPIADTLPGFDANFWMVLVASAKAPKEAVETLEAEILAILKQPGMEALMLERGFVLSMKTGAQFHDFMKTESRRLGPVFKALGSPTQ